MKNKIISTVLLAMCVSIFSGCHSHQFLDATCTSPQICVQCGETQGEAIGHQYMPATYDAPSTCKWCGDTVGEKLVPVSEWGFNNLTSIGNSLIEIDEYNCMEGKDSYVVFNGSAVKFENGYRYHQEIQTRYGRCEFVNDGVPSDYNIVDNDNMKYESNYCYYSIKERKTVPNRDNFVVLVTKESRVSRSYERWFVPYSLIDWDRGVDTITEDGITKNILYLVAP